MHAVRLKALVALGSVDPGDTKEIARLQAVANCISDVRDALVAEIAQTGEYDGGFSPVADNG